MKSFLATVLSLTLVSISAILLFVKAGQWENNFYKSLAIIVFFVTPIFILGIGVYVLGRKNLLIAAILSAVLVVGFAETLSFGLFPGLMKDVELISFEHFKHAFVSFGMLCAYYMVIGFILSFRIKRKVSSISNKSV